MQDGKRLTDEQANELLPLIRGKVRKFVGGERRHIEVRQDLVQDAFVRLLKRLPDFDPSRGSLGDFTATVVDSVLLDHLRYEHAAKRDRRRDRVSLNAPIRTSDGKTTELGRLLDDSLSGRRLRLSELLDLLLDVSEALRRMPPAQREFCERLKVDSVAEIAEREGVVRGTGYRRLRSVREHMQNESLRKYFE